MLAEGEAKKPDGKENKDTSNLPPSKEEIFRRLSMGSAPTAKSSLTKKKGPRPSSARWAELSNTKGMHEETKLKVQEIKKQHE